MKLRQGSRAPGGRQRGFTLVELVMSMTVLSIIGLVTSKVILESMRSYSRTVPSLDASYKSELALRSLKRDVRDLRRLDSISVFTSTSFAFLDSWRNPVSYTLSGTDLTRNGDLLAEGVTSLTFTYWQSDGTTATDSDDLHHVEIDMTVQNGDEVYRARSEVFPRNLGLPL
ncbi:MAG: PulJ/GspJ family protein [Planctomycetota bacterium]|jgi:prepilin-type N-terminal cleavage/methylation domain-containing protein